MSIRRTGVTYREWHQAHDGVKVVELGDAFWNSKLQK